MGNQVVHLIWWDKLSYWEKINQLTLWKGKTQHQKHKSCNMHDLLKDHTIIKDMYEELMEWEKDNPTTVASMVNFLQRFDPETKLSEIMRVNIIKHKP